MKAFNIGFQKTELKKVKDLPKQEYPRLISSFESINNFFGNGWREGSVVHISGFAGLGKTTLMLQLLEDYSKHCETAFITNEESQDQIQEKCERLNVQNVNVAYMNNLDDIIEVIRNYKVVVVDSFQGIVSDLNQHGIISKLVYEAKAHNTCLAIIVHLTKSGLSKGDSVVAHTCDQVCKLIEGNPDYFYMDGKIVILTTNKNRNGPIGNLVFSMKQFGYDLENPWDNELYPDFEKEAIKK